jgi:hypothetical protein
MTTITLTAHADRVRTQMLSPAQPTAGLVSVAGG